MQTLTIKQANGTPDCCRRGVTLVELLLVLAILVVMVSITLPGVLRWQRAMPMEQAVSTMQLQLQETRATAIRTGESWCLILPNAGVPGRRQPLELPHGTDLQHSCLHHSFQLPSGVRCEIIKMTDRPPQTMESAEKIIFYPDGTVRACCLKILTDAGIVTTLQIHRMTGMVTIVQHCLHQPTLRLAMLECETGRARLLPNRLCCRIPELGAIT